MCYLCLRGKFLDQLVSIVGGVLQRGRYKTAKIACEPLSDESFVPTYLPCHVWKKIFKNAFPIPKSNFTTPVIISYLFAPRYERKMLLFAEIMYGILPP